MRITVSQLRRIIREEVARSYEQKQFNEIFGFGKKKKEKFIEITFQWKCPKEYEKRIKDNMPSLPVKSYAVNLLDAGAREARSKAYDRDEYKSLPDGLEGDVVVALSNKHGEKTVDDVKESAKFLARAANKYLLDYGIMKSDEHEGLHVKGVKEVEV